MSKICLPFKMTLSLIGNPRRMCVKSIRRPSEARLLSEPMRREILRILCKAPFTQTQVARLLGLRVPTVGHHLSVLKTGGFVAVTRQEPGKHGIVEKFYESTAQLFFVDRESMPLEVRRYYVPLDIERARGVLACACMKQRELAPSSDFTEKFGASLANSISNLSGKYEVPAADADPEAFIIRLYSEALEGILRTKFNDLRPLLYEEWPE